LFASLINKLNIATRSTSILKMSSLKYSVQDSSHGKPVYAMRDTCATDYCQF
jgi:hypothetical protein